MVEVTQEDINAANSYLSPAKERTVDGLIQAFARHRQAGVQQGLGIAAEYLETRAANSVAGAAHCRSGRAGETLRRSAQRRRDDAAAIRKLLPEQPAQPVAPTHDGAE